MRHRRQSGYTVLEVMIFLAITGVMFASAVVAVGGNQENVQYSQAVRDFETQIKDVINDVNDGYYSTYETAQCTREASGPDIDTGSNEQGTNEDCINIGKTVMFNISSRPDNFAVGTIVGNNPSIAGSALSIDLEDIKPRLALDPINLTEYKPIRYGARVTKIGSLDFPGVEYSSLSFVNSFDSSNSVTLERRENGVLNTDVYGYRLTGSFADYDDPADHAANIISLGDSSANIDVNPQNGFYLCLAMTNNRLARVFVGVDGVPTATSTEFDLDPGGECSA